MTNKTSAKLDIFISLRASLVYLYSESVSPYVNVPWIDTIRNGMYLLIFAYLTCHSSIVTL